MHLIPANYSFIDKNWKPLAVDFPNLPPSVPKELGYGGRDYQIDCIKHLANKKQTLLIAPTGSGKSLMLIFLAAHEILKTNYKQKQVFVVPQLHIGNGFSENQHSKLKIDGKVYDWEITENYCLENEKSVSKIKNFLLSSRQYKPQKANNVLGGCTALVSYSALLKAFNQMTKAEMKKAIKTTSFRIDEMHHIKGVEMDCDSHANQLGSLCKRILDQNGHLHLATATFFRGDNCLVFDNSYLKNFTIFRVEFLEHWKNLNLQAMYQDYESYKNGKDLMQKIIDNIAFEPDCPPIIIVPSDKTKIFKTVNKNRWVKELVSKLGRIYGKHKVLDLVSPDRQKQDKKRLLSQEQDFCAVVTCMIGREGTDWPPCSRIHNTVLDASVLMSIQKLGRSMRKHDGKIDVKMINYIEYFESWDQDPEKIRQLLSNRFNAVVATSMWDEMLYPILMPALPQEGSTQDKTQPVRKVTLTDVYGNKRNEVMDVLIREISAIPPECKNSITINDVIRSVISDFEDDMLEQIDPKILFDRFKQEVVRMHSRNNQDLKLKGIDINFVRESGWDKVIRKHVIPNSPFTGTAKTEDLKKLAEFLMGEWYEQLEMVKEAGYKDIIKQGSSHSLYRVAVKFKRQFDEFRNNDK